MMPGKFYECSIFRKFSAGEGSIQTQTELIKNRLCVNDARKIL